MDYENKGSMSNLLEFQTEVGEWSATVFESDTKEAKVAHLRKEVEELAMDHSPEEAADCLILLLGHAYICGYDLLNEARKKMSVNRNRVWGPPDIEGVQEHIN